MAISKNAEIKKLVKRREELRDKLRDHFSLPVVQRNYEDFELVVNELERLRKKILELNFSIGERGSKNA